ncbi:hypothetical protein [Micromonospora sp. NPDC005324]|uniref:hypothetical protein n=1 Tax=Micromonospora sp. NPDC005324 TaxID=3157033 RepID=UPI0033A28999
MQPWAIAVSHSRLHLRGLIGDPEGDENLQVLDVVFHDVSRICVSDLYRQFELRLATPEQKAAEEERLGTRWPRALMYLLSSERTADYVVAGRVYWAEFDVSPTEPSPLLQEREDAGVPDQIFYA